VGGRAKQISSPHQARWRLDNGQHILIGAYTHTLALMQRMGVHLESSFVRLKPDLRTPDQQGWQMHAGPAQWGLLKGVMQSRGWTWHDRLTFLWAAAQWQRRQFTCPDDWTVSQLCQHSNVTPRVMTQLMEPLCISALNTRIEDASASVFLRVLHDAFFGVDNGSDLLIPKTTLSELFPTPAVRWLQQHGVSIHYGDTVQTHHLAQWLAQGDCVLLACPSWQAAKLTQSLTPTWAGAAQQLHHQAISTVYLSHQGTTGLPRPMMALPSDDQRPAQFLFDHAAISDQTGLLAAVCSAPTLSHDALPGAILQQLAPLGLSSLEVIQTITEKRATFACHAKLERPDMHICDRLWACGDYIQGPYPATLEGAIRSAQLAIDTLTQQRH
jgi:predicted NAD/FAD-binding protein